MARYKQTRTQQIRQTLAFAKLLCEHTAETDPSEIGREARQHAAVLNSLTRGPLPGWVTRRSITNSNYNLGDD